MAGDGVSGWPRYSGGFFHYDWENQWREYQDVSSEIIRTITKTTNLLNDSLQETLSWGNNSVKKMVFFSLKAIRQSVFCKPPSKLNYIEIGLMSHHLVTRLNYIEYAASHLIWDNLILTPFNIYELQTSSEVQRHYFATRSYLKRPFGIIFCVTC